MKRNIVQASLMVVGVLVLAIGATAQVSQQYRAEIPFNFEAAGQQHAAGKYIVGPVSALGGPIAIRNLKSGKSRMLGLNNLGGNNNWDKPGTLTFVKAAGKYTLSEISTATFAMKMKRTRTAVREVAGGSAPQVEIISVYLN